jgi:hypothetical protein
MIKVNVYFRNAVITGGTFVDTKIMMFLKDAAHDDGAAF